MLLEAAALFGSGASTRTFRVVRKRGEPLLLLPLRAAAARVCLQMYPAQTPRAKIARTLLALALRVPGLARLPKVELPWDAAAPLPAFLRSQMDEAEVEFGALLGNPNAAGRRWTLLLFANGRPHRVVKAGASPRARELLTAEALALSALPKNLPGRPSNDTSLFTGKVGAVAVDFVPGKPPPLDGVESEISALLKTWIAANSSITLPETGIWQCVREKLPQAAAPCEAAIGPEPFRSAVMHGDFAPWNIRASGKAWTVIDWERGEPAGLPGWDWLHYAVQTSILVKRLAAPQTLAKLDQLFATQAWRDYAQMAGFAGRERAWLAAYLLWAGEFLQPAEGRETLREMRELIAVH